MSRSIRTILLLSFVLVAQIASAQLGIFSPSVFVPHASAPTGITFIREVTASGTGSATTPTFTCNKGDFLYIFASNFIYNYGAGGGVTSSSGDTIAVYYQDIPGETTPGGKILDVASCNGNSGSYTLTDGGNGHNLDLAVLEFSGVAGIDSGTDCAPTAYYSDTCTLSTISATTYVIGSLATVGGGPFSPVSGWTNYQSSMSSEATIQGIKKTGAGTVSWAPSGGFGSSASGSPAIQFVIALH